MRLRVHARCIDGPHDHCMGDHSLCVELLLALCGGCVSSVAASFSARCSDQLLLYRCALWACDPALQSLRRSAMLFDVWHDVLHHSWRCCCVRVPPGRARPLGPRGPVHRCAAGRHGCRGAPAREPFRLLSLPGGHSHDPKQHRGIQTTSPVQVGLLHRENVGGAHRLGVQQQHRSLCVPLLSDGEQLPPLSRVQFHVRIWIPLVEPQRVHRRDPDPFQDVREQLQESPRLGDPELQSSDREDGHKRRKHAHHGANELPARPRAHQPHHLRDCFGAQLCRVVRVLLRLDGLGETWRLASQRMHRLRRRVGVVALFCTLASWARVNAVASRRAAPGRCASNEQGALAVASQ
eukprot:Amastigsp_a843042_51.p2 type:complete len:350 gc:universal Amastigsp_a843042_51:2088-1039(-)